MGMRWTAAVAIFLGALVGVASAQEKPSLKTDKEKLSYSLGFDYGSRFPKQSVEVDTKAFAVGFGDALAGGKPVMGEEEFRKVLVDFQQQMRAKMAAAVQQAGEDNKKKGAAFLAENKKQKGVVTLPSGLQYKVIKEGKGAKPKATDTVSVNYRGTLIDGTEFDSSYKRNQPATFPLSGVIKCWTEGVQLMKPGGKAKLICPSDIAYGERGAPPNIKPGATLVFEVELLEVGGDKPGAAEKK
jgi:FKBP-type peptidyl-prolyl cis-trans isomerase FklB